MGRMMLQAYIRSFIFNSLMTCHAIMKEAEWRVRIFGNGKFELIANFQLQEHGSSKKNGFLYISEKQHHSIARQREHPFCSVFFFSTTSPSWTVTRNWAIVIATSWLSTWRLDLTIRLATQIATRCSTCQLATRLQRPCMCSRLQRPDFEDDLCFCNSGFFDFETIPLRASLRRLELFCDDSDFEQSLRRLQPLWYDKDFLEATRTPLRQLRLLWGDSDFLET